jgi:hypothetical protein
MSASDNQRLGGKDTAYSRDRATVYENKRLQQAAWRRENDIIRLWCESVPPGSSSRPSLRCFADYGLVLANVEGRTEGDASSRIEEVQAAPLPQPPRACRC